jgi:hypothetical protein
MNIQPQLRAQITTLELEWEEGALYGAWLVWLIKTVRSTDHWKWLMQLVKAVRQTDHWKIIYITSQHDWDW